MPARRIRVSHYARNEARIIYTSLRKQDAKGKAEREAPFAPGGRKGEMRVTGSPFVDSKLAVGTRDTPRDVVA